MLFSGFAFRGGEEEVGEGLGEDDGEAETIKCLPVLTAAVGGTECVVECTGRV